MDYKQTLRAYYQLTKPGIIMGNLLTCAAGFLFVKNVPFIISKFLAVLAGSALIIAGACIYNNYLDRSIDTKMKRTKNRRALTDQIALPLAMTLASLTCLIGFGLLAVWTNLLTVLIGLLGLVVYVLVYGYFKRHSPHGTLVGCVSGAMPPVAGYTAASGHFDIAAGLLLLIMTCWQLAHFYAIAIYRFDDYKRAGLPVMPVARGLSITKWYILGNIGLFAVCCLGLRLFGYIGWLITIALLMASLGWLGIGAKKFRRLTDDAWARSMFFTSLLVIVVFSVSLSINRL